MFYSKWTFSLTSLVLILALSFVAPSAMAGEFSVDLSVGPSVDISSEGEIQAAYGAAITIEITTGGVVQAAAAATGDTAQADARKATTLEILDFEVIAYNHFGGIVTAPELSATAITGVTSVPGVPTPIAAADGKSFRMDLAAVTENTTDAALIVKPIISYTLL